MEKKMDLSKQPKINKPKPEPKKWKCTADGKRWTYSDKKKCRYCLPVEGV
jgi:hypothetical protein